MAAKHDNIKLSEVEEVVTEDKLLTYNDKYINGSKKLGKGGMAGSSRIIPAKIDNKLREEVEKIATEAFKAVNLSGVCRIDFLIDKKSNKYYVNEPNTIPGSLSYYLWKEDGMSYKELLSEMIQTSIKEYKNKKKKVRSFDTNILEGYNKGSKGLQK